jgi:mRNA interferase MazF
LVTHSGLYIPSRGDIVFLDFDPIKGHEQKGLRPAFVLSPRSYNQRSSLALLMPITRQQKGYPFEVLLPSGLQVQGVVLVDQIRCLDWKACSVRLVESAPETIIAEVQAKLQPLLL